MKSKTNGSNLVRRHKRLLILLGLTFVYLEVMLRLIPWEKKTRELFVMDRTEEVKATEWYNQWENDHSHLRRTYQAYEIYHLQPFNGIHINIHPDGYRHTWNGAPRERQSPIRIGIFGGSTIWGSHARDYFTVPSYVSKSLHSRLSNTPVQVVNYAEIGFVLSQELHRALRLSYSERALDKPLPRIMVFVDGVNDVLSALTNFTHGVGKPAGLPWEYEKYEYLFKLGKTGEIGLSDIFKKVKTVRAGINVAQHVGLAKKDSKNLFIEPTTADFERLSSEVAKTYIELIKAGSQMLSGLGVASVFILQPIMVEKALLSEDERRVFRLNQYWQGYLKEAYRKIREHAKDLPSNVTFYDWGALFAEDNETRYNDILHYSESGNEKIGDRLAGLLVNSVPKVAARNRFISSTN
ncbi:MAG: hypothetical protein HY537_11020 [Deltaproteobacteria bacterium]|nr:hypothetical protein [Deltaproteobacteria bacterium]